MLSCHGSCTRERESQALLELLNPIQTNTNRIKTRLRSLEFDPNGSTPPARVTVPTRGAPSVFRVCGLRSGFQGFGFRVSGFGFRVSGFGFRVSGFWFRVSGVGLRGEGAGFRVASPLPCHLPSSNLEHKSRFVYDLRFYWCSFEWGLRF